MSATNTTTVTPPLKWAGGKRWLLPHIQPIRPAIRNRRYVEPFCGGLAIALGLQPRRALLNDINPHLINFYQHIRLSLLPRRIDTRYNRRLFYKHRRRFNYLIQNGATKTAEAAELFYYLNRTCFNGLCRFNQEGRFNVPFGQYKTVHYLTDFDAYSRLFRHWTFTNKDLETLPIKPDDFIYSDPPYDGTGFTTYSPEGFSWDDQVRTARFLCRHRGPVLLSNLATKRIIDLYKGLHFNLKFLNAPRRISCNGNRLAAREVLASRNL